MQPIHWYEYRSGTQHRATTFRSEVTCEQCRRYLASIGSGPDVKLTCDRTLKDVQP